jgi:hypothetical protein
MVYVPWWLRFSHYGLSISGGTSEEFVQILLAYLFSLETSMATNVTQLLVGYELVIPCSGFLLSCFSILCWYSLWFFLQPIPQIYLCSHMLTMHLLSLAARESSNEVCEAVDSPRGILHHRDYHMARWQEEDPSLTDPLSKSLYVTDWSLSRERMSSITMAMFSNIFSYSSQSYLLINFVFFKVIFELLSSLSHIHLLSDILDSFPAF